MTLAELHDDWLDQLRAYDEKLRVTARQFTRQISFALGLVQREAELVRSFAVLAPLDATGATQMPLDCLRITLLRGQDGNRILHHSFRQAERFKERYDPDLTPDTPAEFSRWTPEGTYAEQGHARTAAIYGRSIQVMPTADTGEVLACFYVPMIQPFSASAAQWAAFFPDINFETAFQTLQLAPEFVPYSSALVDFAIARFLRAQTGEAPEGRQRHEVFETAFQAEVRRAVELKPHYMQEAAVDYRFSPFS